MANKKNLHHTTKQHFDLFKKECEKWIRYFGLYDWEVEYLHEDMGDGIKARCYWKEGGKISTLALNKKFTTDEGQSCIVNNAVVCRSAFHEVCELMLCPIDNMLNGRKTYFPYDADREMHRIIRILENTIWKEHTSDGKRNI